MINNNSYQKAELGWKVFVVTIFLLLFPVYLWRSGLPQIADILFALLAAIPMILLFLNRQGIQAYDFNLFLFSGLTFFINIIHYFFKPDIYFLAMSFVYLYNILLFIFIRHTLIQQACTSYPASLKANYYYALFGIVLLAQIIYITLFQPAEQIFRLSGSFNNPNQLALWGVCLFGIALVLAAKSKFNSLLFTVLIFSTIVVFFSLSRTGMILILFLWGVAFLRALPEKPQYILLMFFIAVGSLIFYALLQVSVNMNTVLEYKAFIDMRFDAGPSSGEGIIEEILSRGYQRVIEEPYWLLIGAGEGGYDRFDTGLEIHSGFVSIFFSYGFLGLLLFLNILYPLIRRANNIELAVLFTLFAFNITHQSLRFSMFWVVLAFIAAAQYVRHKQNSVHSLYRSPPAYKEKSL